MASSSRQNSGNPGNGISLNVHLSVPQANMAGQDGSHTPNTPEILNSIVNMQNGPFADYTPDISADNGVAVDGRTLQTPNFGGPAQEPSPGEYSNPAPVSVQQYTTQFIKDGLRLKLAKQLGVNKLESQQQQQHQQQIFIPDQQQQQQQQQQQRQPPAPLLLSPMEVSSPGSCYSLSDIKTEELTEEDMLRRMRRRERNKVAATKCRNKKKLKTQILVKESETLVSQNHHLKSEIHKLEREKKRLIDVLSAHETSCPKRLKTASASNQLNNYDMLVGDLPTTVGYSQPQKNEEAPLYSDSLSYSPLPSIKVEDLSSPVDDDIFLRPPEPLSYYDGSLFQTHRNHLAHVPHHFLGVKTLGHTYLDLDSRCIAL